MTDNDFDAIGRRVIQRAADANANSAFADWPAADRDAYMVAVRLLTLPPAMTAKQVRALVGNALGAEECADLADSANADREECREWLPRYKLALALLAQMAGLLDGLAEAYQRDHEGRHPGVPSSIPSVRAKAAAMWAAHLKCVAGDLPG